METSALPAQYGHHAAAAINAVTKSGTNVLHGGAFEFMRDSSLNAKNAFAAIGPDGKRKDDGLRRDQFGGTLGGPILTGKLFYFAGLPGYTRRCHAEHVLLVCADRTDAEGRFLCDQRRRRAMPDAPSRCVRRSSATQVDPALFSRVALERDRRACRKQPIRAAASTTRARPHTFENIAVGRVDYQATDDHQLFGRYQLADYQSEADYDPNNILAYSALAAR